jgi:N-acetyl-anhydromuramyl-L-alanine amidase AmpD
MATPLTADRFLAALRAEGCAVREVRSWRTHNRNHKGAWGPINGVMIHHTATGSGTDVVDLIYDGYSGLPGPLAHGCITKDGTVHLVGNGRANHAGGGDPDVLKAVIAESYGDYPPQTHEHQGSAGAVDGNARFYGWECENKGDGSDSWPRVQYVAMVRSSAAICRTYGWSAKSVIGHLEWSDWKVDPRGFTMPGFRRDVAACLAQPAGRWPGTEEDTMALTSDDLKNTARAVLTTDGIIKVPWGTDTNQYWQLGSILVDDAKRLRRVEALLAAQSTAIEQLAAALAAHHQEVDADQLVARITAAIESVTVHLDVQES